MTPHDDYPRPVRLNRRALAVLGGLGLLFVLALLLLPSLLWQSTTRGTVATDDEAPPAPSTLPDQLTKAPKDYSELRQEASPPVAEFIRRTPTPPPQVQQQDVVPPWMNPLAPFQAAQQPPAAPTAPTSAAQPVATPPQAPPLPSRRKHWDYLAKGEETSAKTLVPDEVRKALVSKGEGQDIIHNAKWAIPAQPLLTLYKSMELPGRLRRSMNSDLPGIALCELSIPIFDKFGYGRMILDKGTVLVLKQEKGLDYGNNRVPIKLDQIELPSGEVVIAKAGIEDAEGKTGLTGHINNHYGKLLLATGINALLSVGTNALTGTPGGFYANPAQQAARDVSQSTAGDIRSITNAQLKVPPTVEIAAGTVCVVQLDENITFSKKPLTVP